MDEAGQQERCGEIEEQAATLPGDKYQPLMLVSFLIVKRNHIYIYIYSTTNLHDTEDLVHAKVLFICLRKQMSVLEGDIFVQGKDPRI